MTFLSRNPFLRETTIRETVPPAARKPCRWCGNAPGRFRYGTSPDFGRGHLEPEAFCSKSCRDSYRG